jgi:hypothetical protein
MPSIEAQAILDRLIRIMSRSNIVYSEEEKNEILDKIENTLKEREEG